MTWCCSFHLATASGRAKRSNHQGAYDFAVEAVKRHDIPMHERIYLEVIKACKVPTVRSGAEVGHKARVVLVDSVCDAKQASKHIVTSCITACVVAVIAAVVVVRPCPWFGK